MTISILAAVLMISGLVTVAVADHHYHGCNMCMKDMTKMDGNQDNLITFEELSGPHMESLRSVFSMLDTDNDESISKQEWDDFLTVHNYKEGYQTN